MTFEGISNIRLINQRISKTEFTSPKDIVSRMGAIQSQDYSMAKWAVGIRLSDSTDAAIEDSFIKGEIVRTHIMRPTWHFVSAEDIYWMLDLTAPQILSSLKSRHKELELTEAVRSKSNRIIEKALTKRMSLTREELSDEFNKAKILTNENRLSHLLLFAELKELICSGPVRDKKQTYALLNGRIPVRKVFTREESLAELARRYFTSHGPATVPDFSWWSGLSVTNASQALGFVKTQLISEKIDSKEYWFKDSLTNNKINNSSVHLIPAYDEFLISYKDRSASLTLTDNKKVISDNGIFRPVIIINGQVAGLWKCTRKNGNMIIEINFLQPQDKSIKDKTENAAKKFGNFSGKATSIRFTNN